ncbi:MAG: flagellar basal body P-ring formation chaperone FlgA [Aestuariivirga sp.]
MRRLLFLAILLGGVAEAQSLVPTRTLRATEILAETDLTLGEGTVPGALSDPAMAIGQEARVTLYSGRPIRAEDIGPPAIIERNQIVPLAYGSGGLSILTEGRAMARGGAGDVIRVMNLASRTTVTGQILPNGTVTIRTSP